jgi:hypothetical protein
MEDYGLKGKASQILDMLPGGMFRVKVQLSITAKMRLLPKSFTGLHGQLVFEY